MVKETHLHGSRFFISIVLPWINLFLLYEYNILYKIILISIILYFSDLGALLPDIDLKSSYISKKIPILSNILGKKCRHRGFTHSLLCTFFFFLVLNAIVKVSDYNIVLMVVSIGLLTGYISHLFLDLFTKEGIELFYPCKINFYLLKIKTNSKIEKKISKVLSNLSYIGFFLNIIFIFNLY